MSNLKDSTHLFINTSLLELKTIEKIPNILHTIAFKFNEALQNSTNTAELHKNLFHNDNNKFLFYTGLDKKLKDKCDKKVHKAQKIIENSWLIDSKNFNVTITHKNVKIRLNNEPKKRLLGIVFTINIEKNQSQKLFILFPLEYIVVHK